MLKKIGSRQKKILFVLSFILPLLTWSAISYVPFIWHPMVKITEPGDSSFFEIDMLVKKSVFREENSKMEESGKLGALGKPANPIYLPPPHKVGTAMFKSFTVAPRRAGEPWLHESLLHSISVIMTGFLLSSLIGVPLGILCGTFKVTSNLTEPFIEFFRYLPAPAFGALAVAILGINDAPKVAIIFIGTFFQQVLVIANTTRKLDMSLVEAAQTLGATRKSIITTIVIPGIIPDVYKDMRILLGWAWTYLIVAEVVGTSTGITWFINQQAKYRNFENVYAAIIMIGIIGILSDQFLALIGKKIFPWENIKEND